MIIAGIISSLVDMHTTESPNHLTITQSPFTSSAGYTEVLTEDMMHIVSSTVESRSTIGRVITSHIPGYSTQSQTVNRM